MDKVLSIAIMAIFLASCIGSNDKKTIDPETVIKSDTIKSGVEAILTEDVGFWDKKQLAILKSSEWENAKTNQILHKGSKIFVMDVDSDFIKVMTPINIEGFIVKTHLIFHSSSPDSLLYFSKKTTKRINSHVDGTDVQIVNLWDDKEKRTNIVEKMYNNNPVALIESQDGYVKLMTINGIEGWCMKGFLK